MVNVPSGREVDQKSERSEHHLSRPGCTDDYGGACRDRLKTIGFSQTSCRGRLLFPIFILQLLTEEAATLAGVPGFVLFLAEISCYIRAVEREKEEFDTIA